MWAANGPSPCIAVNFALAPMLVKGPVRAQGVFFLSAERTDRAGARDTHSAAIA